MNNKQFILFIFFVWGCLSVSSQSVDEIKSDRELYLYGEGRGETLKDADNAALVELTSKISINVQSDFTGREHEITQGKEFASESEYQSVINTYSQATLNNTERIVLKSEPNAHVFRYIRRSEIDRIFEGRKNKIIELIGIAVAAEENGQVDDALRYYYWAYVLLKSMRYPNEVKYDNVTGNKQLLVTWLPTRINAIFNDLIVCYQKRDQEDANVAEISITYKGKPVRSLGYTYFDGMSWSNVYAARDGLGIMDLRSNSPDNIQIKYEYECLGEALMDNEITDVLKAIKSEAFPKAYSSVNVQNKNSNSSTLSSEIEATANHTVAIDQVASHNTAATLSTPADHTVYNTVIKRICDAITQKNYFSVKNSFTTEGYDLFTRLIGYGKARIVDASHLSYLSSGDEIYCRNLMMSFDFAGNKRKFVENITFTFNAKKQIDNVTFGLGKESTDDILKMESWGNESKLVLINFLENYKTAYALKRWDYINSIFSEDALIITGKVVQKATPGREGLPMTNNRYVEFTRHNKADYMKKLRLTFQRNEYINLRFANTDLTKMGEGGELYGIQIKQDYFSSSYGDTGYLFLMVDLNHPKEPVIHVRTWQPECDPNFGVIGPGFF